MRRLRPLALIVAIGLVALFGSAIAGGAGPADYLRTVSTVSSKSPSNSNSPKTEEVVCPAGTQAIAGAAAINGPKRGVVIEGSGPSGGRGWSATAFEARSVSDDWSLTVTATCADTAGDPTQSGTDDAGPRGPQGPPGPPGQDALPGNPL